MDLLKAVDIVEGVQSATHDQFVEAWQFLIDTGAAWKLQGWYGRTANDLIRGGHCNPPSKGVN